MGVTGTRLDLWPTQEVYSFLHDMYNKYISTNTINTHYILLCHTGHTRPDGDRRQAHAYPRQRLSRIPFRHACKIHEDDYHHKYTHFQQHGNHQYASMQMIISHEITSPSKWGGVINVPTNTPKILCRGSECLPSRCGEVGVLSKTFESFLPLSKILFWKYWN